MSKPAHLITKDSAMTAAREGSIPAARVELPVSASCTIDSRGPSTARQSSSQRDKARRRSAQGDRLKRPFRRRASDPIPGASPGVSLICVPRRRETEPARASARRVGTATCNQPQHSRRPPEATQKSHVFWGMVCQDVLFRD
jgi:hypothetical protein